MGGQHSTPQAAASSSGASGAPAAPLAAAARKKTKQENKQESGAALIAKLEAEGPFIFCYSFDANSSELITIHYDPF